MSFNTKYLDLGRVKVGTVHKVSFPFDATVSKILEITVSCGCTLADTDMTSRQIKVTYTVPDDIPAHLKNNGKLSYTTTKQIVVIFESITTPGTREVETLTFSATVERF